MGAQALLTLCPACYWTKYAQLWATHLSTSVALYVSVRFICSVFAQWYMELRYSASLSNYTLYTLLVV